MQDIQGRKYIEQMWHVTHAHPGSPKEEVILLKDHKRAEPDFYVKIKNKNKKDQDKACKGS